MGSCVSVHKHPESAMKLRLFFGSRTDKVVNPSPLKEKTTDLQLKSQSSPSPAVSGFRDFGSKEETFFDSQPWLDSDCDDDFVSVNGDFTPSRGSTPVHPSFLAGNLTGNRAAPASFQQSPPQVKKKRLSELLNESLRSEQEFNEQNAADNQNITSTKKETPFTGDRLPPRSTPGTPYASVCNSERTHSGELRSHVKSSKPAQCCLPRLLSSRSFRERRKRMSPAYTIG